jgi:hypothetical protein
MMFSRFVIAAFLGSFLPSLVVSSGEDVNITTSEDQYVFWAYYSAADCSSLVTLSGVVALEEVETATTPDNKSCAREVSCLIDPQSAICASLEPNGVAAGYGAVLPNDDVYACDSTGVFCETSLPDSCNQSSFYPSCKYGHVRQDELADPTLFRNENTEDQAALSEYYYLVYYDNADCTRPIGLRAFVTGEQYELPILPDSVTCQDAMACLYAQDGAKCKERGGGSNGTVPFSFKSIPGQDSMISSNAEYTQVYAGGVPGRTPEECTRSSAFVGTPCLFRLVSASYLARNPGALVGEFGSGNVGSDDMETSPGATSKHPLCAVMLATSMVLHYMYRYIM